MGRRSYLLPDQRFDQRQSVHDDDGAQPGREDRRPAQLAQVDARRTRDERRSAGLHAAGGRRRPAHGPLRDAGDRRADARRASRPHRRLLVSPTYYGVAADLAAIERIVHDAGKLLLVDEAWGPHFHFHPALPLSATAAGADLCINSTHKMLSSFSQCAMLHHKGERVAIDRLKSVLKMFLSTSPNLPMVASLDVARKQMATEGAALLSRTIELAEETRRRDSTRSRASTASARRSRAATASSISTRRRSRSR